MELIRKTETAVYRWAVCIKTNTAVYATPSLGPRPQTNPRADHFQCYVILEAIYVPDEVWGRDCTTPVPVQISIYERMRLYGPCMAYRIGCYGQTTFQFPGGRHTWGYKNKSITHNCHQSINQSIKQASKQASNQSNNQSINQSIDRSIDQ